MSVVLSYANKDVAIIACDGRVVDDKNNIISETHKKYIKVNDKVLVGYAGELSPCESVVSLLSSTSHGDLIKQLSHENIHGFIKRYCESFPKNTIYNFIITGIGENNQIAVSSVSYTGSSDIEYITGDRIYFQGIYPKEINGDDPFNRYIYMQEPIYAMKSTINYCALRSPSVNDSMYFDFVRLAHE